MIAEPDEEADVHPELEVNHDEISQDIADNQSIDLNQFENPRIHSITRSGRAVQYRSEMFTDFTRPHQGNHGKDNIRMK
jgi:hypothetical protein